MIELAGLIGLSAFVVASLVVGGRILLLASRTRQLPETTVGLSLVLAGGVGAALAIVPALFTGIPAATGHGLHQLSSAVSHLGYIALFVFVWRVFRPDSGWALVLVSLCTAGLLAGGVGIALTLQPGQMLSARGAGGGWFWLSLGARIVVYSWASLESFHYFSMLKRRAKIGLADEAIARRFYYWGVCTTAVVCIWLNMALQQLAPADAGYLPWANLVSALLGFVVAGSLWRAFFARSAPPETSPAPAG
ncbi:MAG: hypothetical protein ACQGVC_11520 [Myxococcota bacterium]